MAGERFWRFGDFAERKLVADLSRFGCAGSDAGEQAGRVSFAAEIFGGWVFADSGDVA